MTKTTTAPLSHFRAVKELSAHVTAIENLRPQIIEILDRGHGAPLRHTVLSELHNVLHEMAAWSLHIREN